MEVNNIFNASISGLWIGETTDDYQASFEVKLFQKNNFIEGAMKITEPNLGVFNCSLDGELITNKTIKLNSKYHVLGFIPVSGSFDGEMVNENEIKGRWNSGMGQDGLVTIRRYNSISE